MNEPLLRNQPGAISERKAAVATPNGTAISIAKVEVTMVPQTKAKAPNSRWLGSGSQVDVVKNRQPLTVIDSQARQIRIPTRATTRRITNSDAPKHKARKTLSPIRLAWILERRPAGPWIS